MGFASWSVSARHSTSGRQPNFAALNRGCHLYSAGRPSRWTLAHISSSIYLLLLFPRLSQRSQTGCSPYFCTWCGPSAKLECRPEMCCMRLTRNAGPKNCQKFTIWAPSHNFVGYIFATKARIDNRKKNLLNSNVSPTGPHNMAELRPTSG